MERRITTLTIFSIVVMTLGAFLAGMNDLEFNLRGYIWMFLNCLATSVSSIAFNQSLFNDLLPVHF